MSASAQKDLHRKFLIRQIKSNDDEEEVVLKKRCVSLIIFAVIERLDLILEWGPNLLLSYLLIWSGRISIKGNE